eukprot:scaffold2872_cov112-Isochrysis_galbana.AAC.15
MSGGPSWSNSPVRLGSVKGGLPCIGQSVCSRCFWRGLMGHPGTTPQLSWGCYDSGDRIVQTDVQGAARLALASAAVVGYGYTPRRLQAS